MNPRTTCARLSFNIIIWISSSYFFFFFSLLTFEILQCAESALKSVLGDLSNTYFVGNAPMAHTVVQPTEDQSRSTSFKVYFIGTLWYFWSINGRLASFNMLYLPLHVKIYCTCLFFLFAEIFCQRFFFKSQVIAKNKFNIGKCEDHVWVTKDELMEYFPEQAEFLNKMIIS